MRLARTALALLLAAPVPARAAADADEAARSARASFLAGRHEDAASAWRYLSELGVTAHEPEANLALSLRDQGKLEAATAQWLKSSLLESADGFTWNQRGWAHLATGRLREARESFFKAIDRSSTSATQSEAGLGLGLSAILDAKPKGAAEHLRRAALAGPYGISASAQLTGEAARGAGDRQTEITYLRQAVDVDPANMEALRLLARALDKAGDNLPAWRAYRRLLSRDPADAETRRAFERVGKFIKGDPDSFAGVRRFARPVLDSTADEPPLPAPSKPIRVGLYGAPDGRPATLTRAYLVSNAPFKVTSLAHGVLRDNGRAFDQWEIDYRPEAGLVEVRDASRNILFTAKQPFTIVPDGPRGSVLIKSARPGDPVGVESGDREVRGAVEVAPNPWGFRLIQVAPLEQYLIGVVSLAMPEGSPPHALRAQAVVARTAAVWAMENRPETLERCDLLDDDSTQPTIGVSGELRAAGDAVRETQGVTLAFGGRTARVLEHEDSGGLTEDGPALGQEGVAHLVSVRDSSRPGAPWRTPLDLERFVHEAPPEGVYAQAAAAPPAAARWMRFIDAREMRLRAERRKDLGTLRGIRVRGRTATGRVTSVELEGDDGKSVYEGEKDLDELFGRGNLRSRLFTLQPILDGKRLSRVIVWGAGTGHGLGFSRYGALGMAALGEDWKAILRHYFPRLDLRDPNAKPAAPAGVGPYKRTLNFRKAKPKK